MSSRVSHLNPRWNDPNPDIEVSKINNYYLSSNQITFLPIDPFQNLRLSNTFCFVAQKQFHKAIALVGEELLDRVSYYGDSWIPARSLVKEAISKRKQVGCFRNEEDNVLALSLKLQDMNCTYSCIWAS